MYVRGRPLWTTIKNDPFFIPSPCPQVSAFDQTPLPPLRTSHLTLYTALWSCSVIASAVGFPHLTHTPGGLIGGSSKYPRPESKRWVDLTASPYYTLWHKSYKMNNNLHLASPTESACKTCWNNYKMYQLADVRKSLYPSLRIRPTPDPVAADILYVVRYMEVYQDT